MKLLKILTLTIGLSLASVGTVVAQCPMCKSNVESAQKSEEKAVGSGLNIGILFLMATPYLLVGTLGIVWYKRRRHKKAQHVQISR